MSELLSGQGQEDHIAPVISIYTRMPIGALLIEKWAPPLPDPDFVASVTNIETRQPLTKDDIDGWLPARKKAKLFCCEPEDLPDNVTPMSGFRAARAVKLVCYTVLVAPSVMSDETFLQRQPQTGQIPRSYEDL